MKIAFLENPRRNSKVVDWKKFTHESTGKEMGGVGIVFGEVYKGIGRKLKCVIFPFFISDEEIKRRSKKELMGDVIEVVKLEQGKIKEWKKEQRLALKKNNGMD